MPPRTVVKAMLHHKTPISVQSGPDGCLEQSVASHPLRVILAGMSFTLGGLCILQRSKSFYDARSTHDEITSRWISLVPS
jgi:hypothetical protein